MCSSKQTWKFTVDHETNRYSPTCGRLDYNLLSIYPPAFWVRAYSPRGFLRPNATPSKEAGGVLFTPGASLDG